GGGGDNEVCPVTKPPRSFVLGAGRRAVPGLDTFEGGQAMTRGTLMVAAGLVLGAGGLIAAQHNEKHDAVRTLAVREIAEKLDGKETSATAGGGALAPGRGGGPGPPPPAEGRGPHGGGGGVRHGGRVRTGDRRPTNQGGQGRRDVLRADRVSAPAGEEPGPGEDPDTGVGPAPTGREEHRHPGTEEVTPVPGRRVQ